MDVLKQVLKDLQPEKGKKKEVVELVDKIKELIVKNKIKAKVILGGSFAKGTFIRNDYDVDIFVAFDLENKDKDLSRLLSKIINPLKPEKVHGSRDYFQIDKDGINFEIIPVLDIKKNEDAQNVTDFSPLHVKWVKENIGNLQDEIRLAKRFCKAQKVYGAESYIKGISGHVLDILIIYYKGFIPLLKSAKSWRPKKVVDFYKFHKGRALHNLNRSKTIGPLVVIDPVQPDRNAAAVLSEEKFTQFKKAAAAFLRNPSIELFKDVELDLKSKARKGHLIRLEATPLTGKTDIVGSKLMCAFEFLKRYLEDFEILDSGWEWENKALFWYVVKKKMLKPTKLHKGPPADNEKHAAIFKKKYKDAFMKDGNYFATVKQEFINPEQALQKGINSKYVTSKTKKVVIL